MLVQHRNSLFLLVLLHVFYLTTCSWRDTEQFTPAFTDDFETLARLETTKGEIRIRFDPDKAPNHVAAFISLCGSGFYDQTYFHRVAPGFLIQGGDPNTKDDDLSNDGFGGDIYAGSEKTLQMESPISTLFRGAVAMSRVEETDSAGSQFFIVLAETAHLDKPYTVFGEVIEGIDVAEEIAEEPGEPVAELGGFNPAKHQYIERCTLEEVGIGSTEVSDRENLQDD